MNQITSVKNYMILFEKKEKRKNARDFISYIGQSSPQNHSTLVFDVIIISRWRVVYNFEKFDAAFHRFLIKK